MLDALKINKSDILGYSIGEMIAQRLELNYLGKVDDLIKYASYCGGNQSTLPNQGVFNQVTNQSVFADDIKKRIIPLLFIYSRLGKTKC